MAAAPRGRWNPDALKCTRAFSEWSITERYLRTFIGLGRTFAEEGYAARWRKARKAATAQFVSSDDPAEDRYRIFVATGERFDQMVDNLHPGDFDWLLLNLGAREGATLFEVYLEKALHELVSLKLSRTAIPEISPNWKKVARVYRAALQIDPYPPAVVQVNELRNLLTHRRGELVTEELRARYGTKDSEFFPDFEVPLSAEVVTGHLDVLAGVVGRVDAVVWPLAWGGDPLPQDLRATIESEAAWLWEPT
jgi:hypothetical protein